MNEIINTIMQVVTAAERVGGSALGQWALQSLRERFAAEMTVDQNAQLDAHYAALTRRAAESRDQVGGTTDAEPGIV